SADHYWSRDSALSAGVLLVLTIALTWLWVVSPAYAQTAATGALSGTITDTSRAVVPGAKIALVSGETGESRSGVSQTNGTYSIPALPPGSYHVAISKAGFKAWVSPQVTISVTETAVMNAELTVGIITEKVTVEATAEQIET